MGGEGLTWEGCRMDRLLLAMHEAKQDKELSSLTLPAARVMRFCWGIEQEWFWTKGSWKESSKKRRKG